MRFCVGLNFVASARSIRLRSSVAERVGVLVQVSEADPAFCGFVNNFDFLTIGVVKISLAEFEDSYFDLNVWIAMHSAGVSLYIPSLERQIRYWLRDWQESNVHRD